MALVSDADLRKIIEQSDNETLVAQAQRVGTELARQLTTSQIRGIFGSVRRIELDWGNPERRKEALREFALLRPRLAYQARKERGRGRGVEELSEVLTPAMQMVGDNDERFGNFVDFFEAILAYHKAAGGQ